MTIKQYKPTNHTPKSMRMNKFNYFVSRLFFAFFVFITSNYSGFSQEVLLLTGESIASSKIDNNTDVSKFNDFLDLVYNINPAVFVNENGINIFLGESPRVLYTDPDDMAPLFNENLIFRSVELIVLKISHINDLSPSINLNRLRSFFNLKYLYIESTIPITEDDVTLFIRNNRQNIQIIYKLSSQS